MDRYSFAESPTWVDSLSDKDLLEIAKEDELSKKVLSEGKGFCYLFRKKIRTSELANEEYFCKIYNLSQPDVLQGAGVFDEFLLDGEVFIFHRISVIRNEEILDKINSAIFRVLDSQNNSSDGVLDKTKKINIILNDVHLHDIMIIEFTRSKVFTDDHVLHKKYFNLVIELPAEYWTYRIFDISLLQGRNLPILCKKRFFRNKNGEIQEETRIVSQGGQYDFLQHNYCQKYVEDVVSPFLEFSTKAAWEEVSSDLLPYYRQETKKDTSYYDTFVYHNKEPETNVDHKIRSYIEYVQNNVKYIYDAEDMHAHIPQPPSKTLDEKMGDCKAKTNLLSAMLASVGCPSYPVLVNYNTDHFFLERALPSPFCFNHVILKVFYKDSYYFVDPTWRDARGLLEYRHEPILTYYLPIEENGTLTYNEKGPSTTFVSEEETTINLKEKEGYLENVSTYRRGLADIMRKAFNTLSLDQIVKRESNITVDRLNFANNPEVEKVLGNTSIEKIRDDKETNEISVHYKAVLLEPYQLIGKKKIFKYYYVFNPQSILQYRNKDVPPLSFVDFATKKTLIVTSLLGTVDDPITRKECQIDNNYFSFSNKKEITYKKAKVTSIYQPKTFKTISFEELESVKKDYEKILDSNYGIGLTQRSWLEVFTTWRVLLIIYIIFIILTVSFPD